MTTRRSFRCIGSISPGPSRKNVDIGAVVNVIDMPYLGDLVID